MMIDAQHLFSNAQELTATALSTNVIDLSLDRGIGAGEPMAVVFTVDVAADQGTGDEDYTFAIEYGTNEAISTARQEVGRLIFESGSPTAPALNADLLVAGFQFAIPLPPSSTDMTSRYIGVRYTLAGTTPTLTVTAFLQPMSMIDSRAYYASGYSLT
jgi:hypothetical protein